MMITHFSIWRVRGRDLRQGLALRGARTAASNPDDDRRDGLGSCPGIYGNCPDRRSIPWPRSFSAASSPRPCSICSSSYALSALRSGQRHRRAGTRALAAAASAMAKRRIFLSSPPLRWRSFPGLPICVRVALMLALILTACKRSRSEETSRRSASTRTDDRGPGLGDHVRGYRSDLGLTTLKGVAPDGRTVVDFKAPDSNSASAVHPGSPERRTKTRSRRTFRGTYRFVARRRPERRCAARPG